MSTHSLRTSQQTGKMLPGLQTNYACDGDTGWTLPKKKHFYAKLLLISKISTEAWKGRHISNQILLYRESFTTYGLAPRCPSDFKLYAQHGFDITQRKTVGIKGDVLSVLDLMSFFSFPQGWTHRLWTDADVDSICLRNQHAYSAAPNYGQKSDILRYELLERHGGVYVDVDMECVRPLDDLHGQRGPSFYAGFSNTGTVELNNGIIGCVAS